MKTAASLCLIISSLIGTPAAMAAGPTPVIPEAFRGEWYTEPHPCGYDAMEAFIVHDSSTESGESDGRVVKVRILSPTHIVVTTDEMGEATADTPPGTAPSAGRLKTDYQLSGDGQALRVRFGRREPMDYVRCTVAAPLPDGADTSAS